MHGDDGAAEAQGRLPVAEVGDAVPEDGRARGAVDRVDAQRRPVTLADAADRVAAAMLGPKDVGRADAVAPDAARDGWRLPGRRSRPPWRRSTGSRPFPHDRIVGIRGLLHRGDGRGGHEKRRDGHERPLVRLELLQPRADAQDCVLAPGDVSEPKARLVSLGLEEREDDGEGALVRHDELDRPLRKFPAEPAVSATARSSRYSDRRVGPASPGDLGGLCGCRAHVAREVKRAADLAGGGDGGGEGESV